MVRDSSGGVRERSRVSYGRDEEVRSKMVGEKNPPRRMKKGSKVGLRVRNTI